MFRRALLVIFGSVVLLALHVRPLSRELGVTERLLIQTAVLVMLSRWHWRQQIPLWHWFWPVLLPLIALPFSRLDVSLMVQTTQFMPLGAALYALFIILICQAVLRPWPTTTRARWQLLGSALLLCCVSLPAWIVGNAVFLAFPVPALLIILYLWLLPAWRPRIALLCCLPYLSGIVFNRTVMQTYDPMHSPLPEMALFLFYLLLVVVGLVGALLYLGWEHLSVFQLPPRYSKT